MSGRRSRERGKRGERELAAFLTDQGFPATRGAQHRGGPGSPDVLCEALPLHLECKSTERLRLYEALAQARSEARPGAVPVVAHRANRKEWVAILLLEDLLDMLHAGVVSQPKEGP
jgi:Holliday junction resolvase